MGAFLENPMFLFVDNAEPILPITRSTDYGDAGRIVELADVGCDTEATFPIYFPRGASDRRRGGAEGLRSTRRIAKWLSDKPNESARRATDANNNEDRNRNYRRKTRRGDYDDVCTADLDYDDLYVECPYDFAAEEKDEYYQFINSRNAHSRQEHVPRYDYSRGLESSFTQSIRVPQRESTSPRWFAENDGKEMHGTNVQPDDRKKRTKTISRTNGSFNSEEEFGKTREAMMHRERDDLLNDPVPPAKNIFWDFIPFENGVGNEEETFCPTRTKTHGGSQKIPLHGKRSYIFDSQSKRVNTIDSEGEEFRQTFKKDRRENLSPEISVNSVRYRASKDDTVKKKPKILRLLNTSNVISSHQSMKASPISERISNMYPAEKYSINMRPYSATEGKKIKSQTIERRGEITSATGTTVDDRRYKFDKLSNNSFVFKETRRSTRTFDRVASSKSNGRIHTANEKDNMNSYRENSRNDKVDRIDVTVSRLASEEKITKNERMTGASAPRTDMEKEKERKFSSRLPIRIWKRLRTKEPAALRAENDATNGNVNRKFQEAENESAKSSDRSERVENDDVRVKDRAAANCNDVKRSERFGTGSLSADKPGLTSSDLKSIKGIKGLDTARGTQRKKRMSAK